LNPLDETGKAGVSSDVNEDLGSGEVTRILADLREGREGALDALFLAVHSELRRLAGRCMAGQRRSHTLQPTALVNEAYLKLVGSTAASWEERSHFFHAAARAMRQILVDHARMRAARKRGGGALKVTLSETTNAEEDPGVEVLAVHEAMEKLASIDPRKAEVVELRYFGGLTVEETARALDVTDRTVRRIWDRARAWLFREMVA
jgi:RNA polymerase sigma factor (TIGR02999 family)